MLFFMNMIQQKGLEQLSALGIGFISSELATLWIQNSMVYAYNRVPTIIVSLVDFSFQLVRTHLFA